MTLREDLEYARQLAKNEYQVAGRKLAKGPSKEKLGEIQDAIIGIAEGLKSHPDTTICRVHGIESLCVHRWDDETFIAFVKDNLVSVYKTPASPKNSQKPKSPQTLVNIKLTNLDNIDQYFGPLIDRSVTIDH